MVNIPTFCNNFIDHPHQNCYQCREAYASESQGTTAIANSLLGLGIPCDIHQTGGFNMCVYIKTGENTNIYANFDGFAIYQEEYIEGEISSFGDLNADQKASTIIEYMKRNNIQAVEL